jgi:hypothetical protein
MLNKAGGMTQVVQNLPSKHKVLSSIISTAKKKIDMLSVSKLSKAHGELLYSFKNCVKSPSTWYLAAIGNKFIVHGVKIFSSLSLLVTSLL